MKQSILAEIILVLLVLAMVSGCTAGEKSTPTVISTEPAASTPTIAPTNTQIPTPAPTSTPEPIILHTQQGSVKIVKYAFQPSLSNWEPEEGYRLLVLWFEPVDGIYAAGKGLLEDSGEVYITGNDKSNTFRSLCCLADGALVIGFTPPTTASTFTLHWPGNEPIEMKQLK